MPIFVKPSVLANLAGIDALPFGNLVPKEAAPRDGFHHADLSRPVVKLNQP